MHLLRCLLPCHPAKVLLNHFNGSFATLSRLLCAHVVCSPGPRTHFEGEANHWWANQILVSLSHQLHWTAMHFNFSSAGCLEISIAALNQLVLLLQGNSPEVFLFCEIAWRTHGHWRDSRWLSTSCLVVIIARSWTGIYKGALHSVASHQSQLAPLNCSILKPTSCFASNPKWVSIL